MFPFELFDPYTGFSKNDTKEFINYSRDITLLSIQVSLLMVFIIRGSHHKLPFYGASGFDIFWWCMIGGMCILVLILLRNLVINFLRARDNVSLSSENKTNNHDQE
ncbi:MAG: hypothetical protein LBP59_04440 [Planctomycetaceae bacterium]|jgi:uncharacterized membrane protein|nr:hypothetical protein [Planctomycetaceae bacterium]